MRVFAYFKCVIVFANWDLSFSNKNKDLPKLMSLV